MRRLPSFRVIYQDPHSSHRYILLPRKRVCVHPHREPHRLGGKKNGLILITALLKLLLTSPRRCHLSDPLPRPVRDKDQGKAGLALAKKLCRKGDFPQNLHFLRFKKSGAKAVWTLTGSCRQTFLNPSMDSHHLGVGISLAMSVTFTPCPQQGTRWFSSGSQPCASSSSPGPWPALTSLLQGDRAPSNISQTRLGPSQDQDFLKWFV